MLVAMAAVSVSCALRGEVGLAGAGDGKEVKEVARIGPNDHDFPPNDPTPPFPEPPLPDPPLPDPPRKPFGAMDVIGAVGSVKDGVATPVYERAITLTAGVQTTFETRDLSPGSDPVLHLLAPSGTDLIRNDDADAETRNARITVTPAVTGLYRLVLHAFTPGTAGTGRIFKDGTPLTGTVAFAGWRVLVAGIRKGEALETVRLPRSTLELPVMYTSRTTTAGSGGAWSAAGPRAPCVSMSASVWGHGTSYSADEARMRGRPVSCAMTPESPTMTTTRTGSEMSLRRAWARACGEAVW